MAELVGPWEGFLVLSAVGSWSHKYYDRESFKYFDRASFISSCTVARNNRLSLKTWPPTIPALTELVIKIIMIMFFGVVMKDQTRRLIMKR